MRLSIVLCVWVGCSSHSNSHHTDLSPEPMDLSVSSADLAGAEDLATSDLGPTPSPSPSPTPQATFDNEVLTIINVGGSWYFGGSFTRAQVIEAPYFLPLDGNHDLQSGCDLGDGFDAPIFAILRIGGSIYLAGAFNSYQGQAAHYIAKLDAATCALDTTFSPQTGGNGFDDAIYTLASDGTWLYAGGTFRSYRGVSDNANRIARLSLADGSLDARFGPAGASSNGFDANVRSLLVVGTALYAGGDFTAYQGVIGSASRLGRIDLTSGLLQQVFGATGANGVDNIVFALATDAPPAPTPTPSPGPNLYVGGRFNTYNGDGGSHAVGHFVKLSVDGKLDTSLVTGGTPDDILAVAVSADSVYLGGTFTVWDSQPAQHLAKMSRTTGQFDDQFSPAAGNGFDDYVSALALDGGSLYAGGHFTSYLRGTPATVNRLAWLDAGTGQVKGAVAPTGGGVVGVSATVEALSVASGTLYVGGDFTAYGGLPANHIAKLDGNGVVDPTFTGDTTGGFDGPVNSLVSVGSSIYAGGGFHDYRGVSNAANNLAKLDPTTGDLDTTFSSPGPTANGFDATVFALASDGSSLFAGGGFTASRGVAHSANYLAKLDLPSGALDTVFSSPGPTTNGFDSYVSALATGPMPSPAIFVGGTFQHAYFGGTTAINNLAKLDPVTGALDPRFSPTGSGVDGDVNALVVAGDSVYVGGGFSQTSGGGSAHTLAKLALADATLDTTFSPAAANGTDGNVFALLALGGSLYVGGSFTLYRGVAGSASGLAKLDLVSGDLDTAFGANGLPSGYNVDSFGGVGGTLYLGGLFRRYRSTVCWFLARVDAASGALR
jgi:trimeric autotransporter adhesin